MNNLLPTGTKRPLNVLKVKKAKGNNLFKTQEGKFKFIPKVIHFSLLLLSIQFSPQKPKQQIAPPFVPILTLNILNLTLFLIARQKVNLR